VVRDASGKLRFLPGRKTLPPAELGGPRTIYSVNAIPLGGFVRPVGEDNPTVPGGLASAPKRARIAVLVAGSTANLAFAFLIFVAGFMVGWPEPIPDRVEIAVVAAESPAAAAGLREGDVVLRMDDIAIASTEQASRHIHDNLGTPISVMVERDGQTTMLTITPRTTWPAGQGPTGIVLGTPYDVVKYSLPQAVVRSGQELLRYFPMLFALPGNILRGDMPLAAARPIGIVGLNDLTRSAVETSAALDQWFPLLQLVGLVSVALAITNLLPLPALDGGRILFVLIEAVRGRRLDPTREGLVHLVGMVMLLVLMVVITYHDIFNPVFPR
jgi:regulator of sigma E protease